MYQIFLPLHSMFRWLVLIFLIVAIFRAYLGMFKKTTFLSIDHIISNITAKVVQIQFCIGVVLYTTSPLVKYFLYNFNEAIHLREIGFFGMEHITMMSIAVAVISIGSDKVRKATDDKQKYKVMAIWFTIGLLLILTSIPWSFSPLISRPNFRFF
ncbi:MAG: hypothetical protein EOO88_19055 [Pedobacter sp.]|nr:MAG: hypothetical protein EOO88_19055 [Pedobacter sp.]